jgi:hypothetical protein
VRVLLVRGRPGGRRQGSRLISGIEVIPVDHLAALVNHLNEAVPIAPATSPCKPG